MEIQLQDQSFYNVYSELISFRSDWFGVLGIQGTLKSFLQHHNSKASILRRSALFIIQLSHFYMTAGKALALTTWTFFRKVMPLYFNTLSMFVIALLSRSKHLLISYFISYLFHLLIFHIYISIMVYLQILNIVA